MVTSLITMVTWDIRSMNPADSHCFISIITQYLFIKIFVIALGKKELTSVRKENNDPEKCQKKLLQEVLAVNAKTEYGIKHRFSDITTVEQFKENVPLQNYDDYRKYIQRIKTLGTQNILSRDPVVFLAMTSGTTGDYKCVPVTTIMKLKDGFKAGPLMYYSQNRSEYCSVLKYFILNYNLNVGTSLTVPGVNGFSFP